MTTNITWRQHGNRLIGTTPGPTYTIASTTHGYVLARDGVDVERRWERRILVNMAERMWHAANVQQHRIANEAGD